MTHRRSNEVMTKPAAAVIGWVSLLAMGLATLPAHAKDEPASRRTHAEQPPPPCHPNPRAALDMETVANRGDIRKLPAPLKERLVQLAGRPHSVLPVQAFAEADQPSQLFKPGLPTDPNDPQAFIDVFTDIDPLFVINNESGWYEGWMIHDLTVPNSAPPRSDGTGAATFGTITTADADALKAMDTGNNVSGNIFTTDGSAVHFPNASDHFPDAQTNVVPLQESMGAYNAMQQSDVHAYWEFNYLGTNWIHPLYELPFTGGFPDAFGQPADSFEDGEIGLLQSIVPGSGPRGINNMASVFGDNPNLPRDPDKFDGDVDAQREFRQRGIPSGLANEVLLDVYERPASFEPGVTDLERRLFDAYAAEVARVDQNGDGIVSAVEGDIDTASDGFADNTRLFLPATAFNRFAVTREINDGLLAPRFAPSQRAWILTGTRVPVSPAVPASAGRDADDR